MNTSKNSHDFKIVEKNDHNAVHGLFTSRSSAQHHLDKVIPDYVRRGYFQDKTLTKDSFEILNPPDKE